MQELVRGRAFAKLDRFDPRIRKFFSHGDGSVHVELGISQGDQVCDGVCAGGMLKVHKSARFPFADLVWIQSLVFRAGGHHRHRSQDRQGLGQPLGRALLHPARNGVRDDVSVPHAHSELQQSPPSAGDILQDLRWRRLLRYQVRRAEQGVVPVKNDHCLVWKWTFGHGEPNLFVRQLPHEGRPKIVNADVDGGLRLCPPHGLPADAQACKVL
mmetsp:Transcript_111173/g.313723  ORF Transcript_111173/g.313723 Transcript_111173/m.313723 type:complete len:213 (+) Transcript_111173:238-876(+)